MKALSCQSLPGLPQLQNGATQGHAFTTAAHITRQIRSSSAQTEAIWKGHLLKEKYNGCTHMLYLISPIYQFTLFSLYTHVQTTNPLEVSSMQHIILKSISICFLSMKIFSCGNGITLQEWNVNAVISSGAHALVFSALPTAFVVIVFPHQKSSEVHALY